jgi:DNA-binding GntR family transcriptional regulator
VAVSPLRTTITDALVDQLRVEIQSGQIAPGSRLRQAEVAARFNVSTTPVREAFAALEREGLLVGSAHRGVTVFHPTVQDLKETYEIRIPLEALATEKGVENMGAEDVADLARILRQMEKSGDDHVLYNKLNAEFHGCIYRAARRPKLEKLIGDLREASAAYLRFYATFSPSARETQAEHTQIFEACKARAPKRAAKAMIAHLQHTVDFVSRGLAEQEQATRDGGADHGS